MVNYATDLQYLFQSSDAKKPYNIDNVLFQIISESGFENIVNISNYLRDITSIDILREDAETVKKYIESPGLLIQPTQTPPTQSYNFTEDAMANDVYIKLAPGMTLAGLTYNKIITDVTTSNTVADNVVKDHIYFRNYLFDIIEDIVKYMLNEAKEKLGLQMYNMPDTDPRQNVYDAVINLHNMKITKLGSLIKILKEACIQSFEDIFKTTKSSQDITDLKYGSFNSKLYYNVRYKMLKYLDIKNFYTNSDENQVLYFKKVSIDLFLKTCYPLVHMISMQAMLNWYASTGDYVNVRVVVLAMTYYTFFTLKTLYAMNVSIQPNKYQLTQTDMANLNIIFNNLTAYIANNNKINVNSNSTANDEIKELVIGLHELSLTVSNSNNDIQSLKNAVKDNQLAMRNILFNISIKRKDYNKTKTEFIVLIFVVFLFTILNVILLLLNKPAYVYYTSGFIGIAAALYIIVMIIIGFIKGDNK